MIIQIVRLDITRVISIEQSSKDLALALKFKSLESWLETVMEIE